MTQHELDRLEHALVGAAMSLATTRRRNRRLTTSTLVAAAVLATGVASAGVSGSGPLADELSGMFGPDAAAPAPAGVPAGVAEMQGALALPDGTPGRVLHPASSEQPVTLYAYAKSGRLCLIASAPSGRSIGHCVDRLLEAGGHLSVDLGVVDSAPFVWGLAADDVRSISVNVDGQDYRATLAHSAYVVPLPSQDAASSPITVIATLTTGETEVAHVPGLPHPSGASAVHVSPTAPSLAPRTIAP